MCLFIYGYKKGFLDLSITIGYYIKLNKKNQPIMLHLKKKNLISVKKKVKWGLQKN